MMATSLTISLILLGPIFGWIFTRVDCVSQTESQGNYGQPCNNQSCNALLKCLIDTCWCDVSYNWDSEKKICSKLCLGSEAGLVRTGSYNEHYEMYKQKYTNCTYVEGNLELTFLEGDYDLQFLQSIEEVTGYVLIVSVWSNYVPLQNLRIIRGRTLYTYHEVDYALYIARNYNPKNKSQGIFELGFKNLTEITKGKVYFQNNNALCYESSIRWKDINPKEPNQNVVFKSDIPYKKRRCGKCHEACYNRVTKKRHCWGKGPDMCQKLNYGDVCSLSCEGRCFGSKQNQCCHPECAAGCHGPRKSECFACKTFYNDGMCETSCPAEYFFDNGKLTWIKNPNAKYAYGSLCVKVCPEHMLQDQGACVVKCPDKKEPDVNNTACVECVGPCKKTCAGTVNTDFVHRKNIQSFKDCTSIHGNLRILKSTFDGDPFRNISGINISDLQVFKNVKEITGYLAVQQIPSNLRDLSFLSSLEIIQGRDLSSGRFSVSLASMNITELGLKSLQHIKNGDVIIASAPKLCYLENINFTGIFSTQKQMLYKANNKDANTCRREGKVCDPECSQHGCWGPGPFNCLKCAFKRVSENNQCVRSCSDIPLLYENGDTCEKCHAQCAGSCTGPGPSNCTRCKQVKFPGLDGVSGVCMEKCPVLQKSPMYFYPDEINTCQPCHYTCAEGCTGPSSEVKTHASNTYELAINQTLVDGTISCLPHEDCPKGYYKTQLEPLPVSILSSKNGDYGQPCNNTSCNAPFKCLIDTCWCDVSYNWDSEKKICRKLCIGSEAGLVRTMSYNERYEMYKQKYTNCTYVEGNLELTFIEGDYDLQFLQNIEEVTGYVLIVSVWSNYVPLQNLRIIRGRTLFTYHEVDYALYIARNYNPNNNSQGIFELGFKNLTEITKGKVYFHNNNALCYETSIRWQDINPKEPNEKVFFKSDTPSEKRPCGECHEACYNRVTKEKHCWGQGPDMCQKLNYGDVCSLSCEGRCFGSEHNQCCHPECVAGCHGPRKSECFACKTFYNDGMCETNCPAESIYDNGKLTWITNPNAKYAYGSLCVKECPEHLLQNHGACVVKCPDKMEPDVNNTACVECVGPCKKTCAGTVNTDFVHQKNIQSFKDCTSIHGNLRILKSTFDGNPFENIPGINISDLQVFKTVKEITGYLAVQMIPSELRDLSFLSSLEIIQGRDLSSGRFSVSLISMNITELGLKSLQHIKNGDVIIASAPNLCYLENLNFTGIFSSPKQVMLEVRNKDANSCRAEGKVCDPECSHHGCWGLGPLNCLKCAYKRVSENNQCVHSCSDIPLLYENGDTCEKCHAQCALSCNGPGPSNCTRCKQVKFPGLDGVSGVCMEKCPVLQNLPMYFYPDERNTCQPCNYTCAEGCTGPSSEVNNGGCNTCELAINHTLVDGTISCLPHELEDCPKGYYKTRLGPSPVSPLSHKNICQPCHALCMECNGPDIGTCTECRFFKHFSLCVSGCPNYTFPDTSTKSCHQCDNECVEGCTGPSRKDCTECKNYKIIHSGETVTFECVEKCPPNLPYLVENDDPDKRSLIVCADETHPQVLARMSADQEKETGSTSAPML